MARAWGALVVTCALYVYLHVSRPVSRGFNQVPRRTFEGKTARMARFALMANLCRLCGETGEGRSMPGTVAVESTSRCAHGRPDAGGRCGGMFFFYAASLVAMVRVGVRQALALLQGFEQGMATALNKKSAIFSGSRLAEATGTRRARQQRSKKPNQPQHALLALSHLPPSFFSFFFSPRPCFSFPLTRKQGRGGNQARSIQDSRGHSPSLAAARRGPIARRTPQLAQQR